MKDNARTSITKDKKLIGQELVKAGIITPKQLHQVLAEQRKVSKAERELVGEIILRRGYASEEQLMTFLEKYIGVSYVRLRREQDIELSVVKMIPEVMARKLKVAKRLVAVENTRGKIGKASMIHNAATPKLTVDPETYAVTADGVLLVCEPAERLPMAQRYFLF